MYDTIKELRAVTGWSQQKFADYFDIPRRTVQNWELPGGINARACPPYLLRLMIYKLEHENIIDTTPD